MTPIEENEVLGAVVRARRFKYLARPARELPHSQLDTVSKILLVTTTGTELHQIATQN